MSHTKRKHLPTSNEEHSGEAPRQLEAHVYSLRQQATFSVVEFMDVHHCEGALKSCQTHKRGPETENKRSLMTTKRVPHVW